MLKDGTLQAHALLGRMAIFFFNIDNGAGYHPDCEGTTLASIEAARRHAMRIGAEIMADEIISGSTEVALTVYVTDRAGSILITMPMRASAGIASSTKDPLPPSSNSRRL